MGFARPNASGFDAFHMSTSHPGVHSNVPPTANRLKSSAMEVVNEMSALQVVETPDVPLSSSSATAASPKKDLWHLAAQKLKSEAPKLAEALDAMSKAAVVDGGDIADNAIAATNRNRDRLVERQWQIHFRSKTVKIKDQFDRILTILRGVKDFGSAAAGLDPVHAGLPWAGVCLLLQLALSDSDQYAAIISNVEEVSSIISRYKQIEIVYLQDEDLSYSEVFEARLISLYALILKFEVLAACYFRKNTMSRFLRSIPKLDDSSSVLIDIRKWDSVCKDMGQIFALQDARKYQKQTIDIFKTHDTLLETMMKELREQDTTNARILRWVSDLQYDAQHRFLKGKLGDDYQRSGEWLLETDPSFREWRHNATSPALFWLHGRVGTGKSSIAYLTIESLCRHKIPDERVAYYYCVRSQGSRIKPDEILGSLLRQISWSPVAMSVSSSIKVLHEMALKQDPNSMHSNLSLSENIELLEDVISSSPMAKFVIDALDECADHRLLLKSLKQLWVKFPGRFKLFVTSRESIDIQRFVSESSGYEIDNRGNASDVERFINKEIEKRADYLLDGTSKDLEDRLRTILVDRAYGMFRWVELQLAIFLDSESGLVDKEDVIEKLDELEKWSGLPDLNAVYEEIYERNTKGRHSRSVANRVLKWMMALAAIEERLSNFNAKALVLAVSIEADGTPNSIIDQDYVLRVCSNLVVLNQSASQLVFAHLSVWEYLAQRNLNDEPNIDFDDECLHGQVAESCLLYLNQIGTFKFARYKDYDRHHGRYSWDSTPGDFFELFAFYFWPFYSSVAGKRRMEEPLQQAFNKFLWNANQVNPKFETWLVELGANLYHLPNLLSDGVRAILKKVCCSLRSPLFLACAFNFPDVIDVLRWRRNEDLNTLNSDGDTGLKIATICGYPGVVRCLIKHGVDLEAASRYGNTRRPALLDACESGNTEIVRVLLAHGAKTNEETSFRYTPKTALHAAIEEGYLKIVELLLEAKADCNAVCRVGMWADRERQDSGDMSDLDHAMYYVGKAAEGSSLSREQFIHRESIVRELNLSGKSTWDDLEFFLCSHWAPIHFLITCKRIDMVEMLINYGAKINAQAGHGETALHMAIETESLKFTQCLLDHGADSNARSRTYGTTLMMAGRISHESMVRLFLNLKARDSNWAFDLGEAIGTTVLGEGERSERTPRDAGDEDDRPLSVRKESIIRLLQAEGANLEAPALEPTMRYLTGVFDPYQLDCYQMYGLDSSTGKLDIPGVRPLYIAAVIDDLAMTRLLLELGADVNAKDDGTHMPAIYEAVVRGHEDVAKALLAAGADIEVKDGKTTSLVEAAEDKGFEAIAQLLRDSMVA